MEKVRIGMVGTGFVTKLHLDAYRKLVGVPVELAGVVSRSKEKAEKFAQRHGISRVYDDYHRMLEDREIDIVDVCYPNKLHAQVCIDAARAGKHIICEKPLTGAFGEGIETQSGRAGNVPRLELFREAMKNADAIVQEARRNKVKLCYAEDFIYAPVVVKAKRLIKQSGGAILDMRSEESHSGSHAAYSRQWELAGGGSLLRLGSHPLGLVLHLKHDEGLLKQGKPVNVKSVMADVGNLTHTEIFKGSTDRWVVSDWQDVEDWAVVVLTFTDGTKATIQSNDITLGGIVNTLDIYTTNCVLKCDMAANDAIKAYAPSTEIFGDEYISEKIETKAGWTFPSPDEDWMRGYPQEMQDFVESVYYNREPVSDGELGRQVVQVIYAAYLSAEQGRRIDLSTLNASGDGAG